MATRDPQHADKLYRTIEKNLSNKSTSELLTIWENNDRGEFTAETFELIKQILIDRDESLPKQKEFLEIAEEPAEKAIDQEQIKKLINKAMETLLIWGIINTVYWYFGGAEDRTAVLIRFAEIKPWLWMVLYGSLLIGILLILLGCISLLYGKLIVIIFCGVSLVLVGLWNITAGFMVMPALAQYDIEITLNDALKEMNKLWWILGAAQLYWGIMRIDDYFKIKRNQYKNLISKEIISHKT